MKNNFLFVFMALGLLFTACVPQSPSGGRTNSKQLTNPIDTATGTATSSHDLYWFTDQSYVGSIIINANSTSVAYLRGNKINSFLKGLDSNYAYNYLQKFCLLVSYTPSGYPPSVLRVKAVPESVSNYSSRVPEWLLRLDIPYGTDNQGQCQGSINAAAVSYKPKDVCVDCRGVIPSVAVNLYRASDTSGSNISSASQVTTEELDLSTLILKIDNNSTTTNPSGSCSVSDCQANGYDCCIDRQCVKDRSLRPNASSDPDYNQAIAAVAANPARFVDYQHIYYVCGSNTQAQTPVPTATVDPWATASETLTQNKADYDCLAKVEETSANGNAADYGMCSYDGSVGQAAWNTIRRIWWRRCGCAVEMNPPNDSTDPHPYCPNFSLRTIYDASGHLTWVGCNNPTPVTDPTPFQELSVDVSGRSAPHRFFAGSSGTVTTNGHSTTINTGDAVDDFTKLYGSSITPEGTPFSYLDQSGHSQPSNGIFNINSILGQMSVTLDQAHPAVTINVEFDQNYMIGAVSGFYNPCPDCKVDSWMDSFTAFPQTEKGMGLRAVGFSTSRDTYSNNVSRGNYEDTKWGRACWVPPTMLPFTHLKNADLKTQRQNRLMTQAALYINGLQRDWYGFNKGALIGSFDGVNWFAIGTGRKVTSTSNKLFLAINAPFADLANANDTIVQITADRGGNVAAEYDFDPSIPLDHPRQNSAGTCQHYHQCSTDNDCITQLGWEYMCTDVSKFKTHWPKFDSTAKELSNDQVENSTYATIVKGGYYPSFSTKRCVYRGAGATCKQNYERLYTTSGAATELAKLFTCAPNFYCASLSSSAFNEELIRTPDQLGSIQYGMEADVLGRPKNYVNASSQLLTAIKNNILDNGKLIHSTDSDFGICRPGKALTGTQLSQHQNKDSSYRSDYISQISSCDSSKKGDSRVLSCPIIDGKGNYKFNPPNISGTSSFSSFHQQNACGAESLKSNGANVFSQVEAGSLVSLNDISEPVVAKDTCFRRAGSACHTDLDCSPNKFHATQAETYSIAEFGGTKAEKEYWEEYLVCAQGDKQPQLQSDDYNKYDLTLNRCCRPIGETLTMYTQGTTLIPGLIPDHDNENDTLVVDRFSKDDPKASGRYSRYSVVWPLGSASNTGVSIYPEAPKMQATNANTPLTPNVFQWKTINDTATMTCCGGGWVRKFSDGGHDWTDYRRLKFDTSNLKCLNYESSLALMDDSEKINAGVIDSQYSQEYGKFCRSPQNGAVQSDGQWEGGCVGVPLTNSDFSITLPEELDLGPWTLNTSPTTSGGNTLFHSRAPYMPNASYVFPNSPANYENYYFGNPDVYYYISFYLPTYLNENNIRNRCNAMGICSGGDISFQFYDSNGSDVSSTFVDNGERVTCQVVGDAEFSAKDLPADNTWCIQTLTDGRKIFHAKANRDKDVDGKYKWSWGGVKINYYHVNTKNYVYQDGNPNTELMGMHAGNDLYYLSKLGRLELLGIPQIFYEPIYCNSDRSKLVPGIFNTPNDLRSEFEAANFSFVFNSNHASYTKLAQLYDITQDADDLSNSGQNIVLQNKVAIAPIFSANEFLCCRKLNQKVTVSSECCSNYAVTNSDTKELQCKLPDHTDLNVYFNRFVSGEGQSSSIPGNSLTDEDYIPWSGEPKQRISTDAKVQALGKDACASGEITRGGAFGKYYPEPYMNSQVSYPNPVEEYKTFYNIVDSSFDYDKTTEAGYNSFGNGYRWNHHWYCKKSSN